MTAAPATARERFAALVVKLGGRAATAKAIGCTYAYVTMIANGERRPGMRIAHAIEKASEGSIPMRDWMEPSEA